MSFNWKNITQTFIHNFVFWEFLFVFFREALKLLAGFARWRWFKNIKRRLRLKLSAVDSKEILLTLVHMVDKL